MTEPTVDQYRKAWKGADYIQIRNDKKYRIMWKWADQFGVRSDETGEQYAFGYEDIAKHNITFLVLCPVDVSSL